MYFDFTSDVYIDVCQNMKNEAQIDKNKYCN